MVSTEVTLYAFFSFCFTLLSLMKKRNWSQLSFVNINYEIIMKQFRSNHLGEQGGVVVDFFFFKWCVGHFLNELCKRHENKIYVIYVSNTSVPLHHPYPYRNASISLQFLQVIIFCKIVLSSKAAIFSFKLQLFLHFFFTSVCMLENSCMAEVHT